MDLALPKFADLGDRLVQPHRPWIVMTDSPASPAPVCSTGLLKSPCLNLDALYSDEDKESEGQINLSVTLIRGSDDCHPHVNSDQVLSDEDLPAAAGTGDRRQVIWICDVSPDVQIVDISQVGRDWDSRRAVWGARHPKDIPRGQVQQFACVEALAPEVRAGDRPRGSEAASLTPVVGTDDIPQVGWMETVQLSSPPDSGQLSPDSPKTVAFEDMVDSSVLLSPNRVQGGGGGGSQDVPDECSLFNVSPVSPGFLMRPSVPLCSNQGLGCRCRWPWIVLVTLYSVI